jgi:hypothetical protein
MFSTLIITLSVHKVNRRLVVAVQLNRLGILSKVFSFSCRSRNEILLAELIVYCTSSKLKEVA